MPAGGAWKTKYIQSNSCTITGLTNGTVYTFKVRAINDGNQKSAYSKTVKATPNASTVVKPAVPTGLRVAFGGNGQVSLAWNANSEKDLRGYYVVYMPDGGSWKSKFFPSNSASITGLKHGIRYTFKVKAVNISNLLSAYSTAVTARP